MARAKPDTDKKPDDAAAAAQTAAAAPEKKRINVHRFTIGGYIEVNHKDTKTIVGAADAVNAAIDALKKAGAVIEKEEVQFTSTTVGGPAGAESEAE